MIKTVVLASVAEDLRNQLDNENWKLHIYKKVKQGDELVETEITETNLLGTGMIIKLIKNDRIYDWDYLVVKYDVNGDGQIRINDVVATANQYLSDDVLLEGPYFVAADVGGSGPDGHIRINDVVGVVNAYLEQ